MAEAVIPACLVVYRAGGRKKIAEEARCRMCLARRGERGRLTRHHLVPQRWGGWRSLGYVVRDADANIVPLCEHCHRDVERDEWARRMLRKTLAASEVAFCLYLRGRVWFDGYYPAVSAVEVDAFPVGLQQSDMSPPFLERRSRERSCIFRISPSARSRSDP